MTAKIRTAWTFAVTSAALFMASLDNLVVTTALPSIRAHLHASLQGLQWTVNAYTLTFAVLLLTGAALGERWRFPVTSNGPTCIHTRSETVRSRRAGSPRWPSTSMMCSSWRSTSSSSTATRWPSESASRVAPKKVSSSVSLT